MRVELGVLIGFILTLFIYSYLVRDNPLYRIATHLLVGVSAGYATVIVLKQVILPVLDQIRQDPGSPNSLFWLLPVLLGVLMLARRLPGGALVKGGTLAALVGIGAAVAITGAISGTLWPQVTAGNSQEPLKGLLVAILTVCTLFSFQFTGRMSAQQTWTQPTWQRGLAVVGRAVLSITFGALFATVVSTSLILLIDRVDYYLNQFVPLLP